MNDDHHISLSSYLMNLNANLFISTEFELYKDLAFSFFVLKLESNNDSSSPPWVGVPKNSEQQTSDCQRKMSPKK